MYFYDEAVMMINHYHNEGMVSKDDYTAHICSLSGGEGYYILFVSTKVADYYDQFTVGKE